MADSGANQENTTEEEQAQERNEAHNIAMRDGVNKAKLRVGAGLGVIGVFAVSTLAFLVILFLPYSPMRITSYDIKPTQACPNQLLKAELSYTIDKDAPIESADAQAIWTAVDVPGYERGETLVGADAPIPTENLQPGREAHEGEILRPAPVTSGVWQFRSITILHGKAPTQVQRLTTKAESFTTVLKSSNPRCKGGL